MTRKKRLMWSLQVCPSPSRQQQNPWPRRANYNDLAVAPSTMWQHQPHRLRCKYMQTFRDYVGVQFFRSLEFMPFIKAPSAVYFIPTIALGLERPNYASLIELGLKLNSWWISGFSTALVPEGTKSKWLPGPWWDLEKRAGPWLVALVTAISRLLAVIKF